MDHLKNGVSDLRKPKIPILTKFRFTDLTGVSWSPNGTTLAAIGTKHAFIGQYFDQSEKLFEFSHPNYLNKATIKNICWIGENMISAGSNNKNVHVWHTDKINNGFELSRIGIVN